MALLQALMGGMGGMGSPGGMQGSDGGFSQFTLGQPGETENESIARAIGGFSPVNQNPNYGGTVSRFFNQNPLAGSTPYTGANPLKPGTAGNNAARSFSGSSSFIPTDFGSSMRQWT